MTMINILRSLMEKVYNIQEQMTKVCKVSLKAVKRNARKNKTLIKMKNAIYRFINGLRKAEERISGLVGRATGNTQSEMQREKGRKTRTNFQKWCNNIKKKKENMCK